VIIRCCVGSPIHPATGWVLPLNPFCQPCIVERQGGFGDAEEGWERRLVTVDGLSR